MTTVTHNSCQIMFDHFGIFHIATIIYCCNLLLRVSPKEGIPREISRQNTKFRPLQSKSLVKVAIHKMDRELISLFKDANWSFIGSRGQHRPVIRIVPCPIDLIFVSESIYGLNSRGWHIIGVFTQISEIWECHFCNVDMLSLCLA